MKKIFIFFILFPGFTIVFGQSGIGVGTSGSPHPSSMLEIKANDKGFLMPRLTTAQRNAIKKPAQGLMVYNTDEDCINYYTRKGWKSQCGTEPPGHGGHGGDTSTPGITFNADNLGNLGGQMSIPAFLAIAKDGNDYYAFFTNNHSRGLVRLNFRNSLLNTPTVEQLGPFEGLLPESTEGLQIVQDANGWHVLIVGGDGPRARIVKLDLGTSLANQVTNTVNWGNIGNMNYPVDLYVTKENNNWYGFTVNYLNNTITRFNFGTSFSNPPVATNLGNLGDLNLPAGIFGIKADGNWHIFVTNTGSNSLSRLDLGTSLANTPTGINLGNPGGVLTEPRDLCLIPDCGNIFALVVNSPNNVAKIDFRNGITSQLPGGLSGTALAAKGDWNFPHSISTVFREGNNQYVFITNARSNTLSRLMVGNCSK